MYKLDSNHAELVEAAERCGIKVVDNARVKRQEPGQFDCWFGVPNPWGDVGVWVWVEIKAEGGELRPAQKLELLDCDYRGLPTEVVRSTADIERLLRKYQDRMRMTA